MRRITVGILAHVDAGKTTLSEALLYQGGRLKKPSFPAQKKTADEIVPPFLLLNALRAKEPRPREVAGAAGKREKRFA